MHRKRGCIMIGVPAFVGMCEHDVRSDLVHQFRDVEDQLEQLKARLPIDVAESAAALRSNPDVGKSVRYLSTSGSRILFSRLEALAVSIPFVARCSIRNVSHDRVGQAGEQSARTNRLIVRVRHHHERGRQSFGESGSLRDPVEYFTRDLVRWAEPSIAIGCDHEIWRKDQTARSFLLRLLLSQPREQKKIFFPLANVERWYEPEIIAVHKRYLGARGRC